MEEVVDLRLVVRLIVEHGLVHDVIIAIDELGTRVVQPEQRRGPEGDAQPDPTATPARFDAGPGPGRETRRGSGGEHIGNRVGDNAELDARVAGLERRIPDERERTEPTGAAAKTRPGAGGRPRDSGENEKY